MTDNLRIRIVAALRTTKTGRTEFHSYQLDDLADAVIRDLGLQPPGLQPDGTYIDPTGIVWRHTGSEWTDDPNYRP